jgi:hypothetical protein
MLKWNSAKSGPYFSKKICVIYRKKIIRKSVYVRHVVNENFEKE